MKCCTPFCSNEANIHMALCLDCINDRFFEPWYFLELEFVHNYFVLGYEVVSSVKDVKIKPAVQVTMFDTPAFFNNDNRLKK